MKRRIPGIFPCRKCLILACCTETCEKIIKKNEHVKLQELKKGICPHCGSDTNDCTKVIDIRDLWIRVECSYCMNMFHYTKKMVINRKMVREVFEKSNFKEVPCL